MKILLDHCVPKRAAVLFPGHDVQTSRAAGLSTFENGELLRAAALSFDVLVTTDKNIRHQHDLDRLPLPVVELNSLLTRFEDLKAIAFAFEPALLAASECRFVSVNATGEIERLVTRAIEEPTKRTKAGDTGHER